LQAHRIRRKLFDPVQTSVDCLMSVEHNEQTWHALVDDRVIDRVHNMLQNLVPAQLENRSVDCPTVSQHDTNQTTTKPINEPDELTL
jgi:hypothetical protein